MLHTIDPQVWKQDLPSFQEKTKAFYAGEIDKAAYKGFPAFMAVTLKRAEKPVCCVCG